jgi:hypothetical protein
MRSLKRRACAVSTSIPKSRIGEVHVRRVEGDQSRLNNKVNPSEGRENREIEKQPIRLAPTVPLVSSIDHQCNHQNRSIHLLRNTVLALIEVGSSTSSRSNASQISSRVGANLDDSSAARRGGADQVESAFYR